MESAREWKPRKRDPEGGRIPPALGTAPSVVPCTDGDLGPRTGAR